MPLVEASVGPELAEVLREVVPSHLRDRLGTLVAAAQQLPMRDLNALKQTRPVIYGLEGGPKVVSQQP